ncbi:MAG: response regulator transcription factor [Candidatus Omnitrophica bacterium]|nr:response regulator transcription factor [Candidatus Omnitrophota bacterium]
MAKRILLIEDDQDLATLVKAFLEHSNFIVSLAFDGKEGLEKAQEKPDVIILDLMLPKVDGVEVLKRLKYDPQTAIIPVIILTARGESEMIFETMEAGSFDYIIKPFDNKELLDAVNRALK